MQINCGTQKMNLKIHNLQNTLLQILYGKINHACDELQNS
jgi:hypothetical protein